jgi:hypothetical protein
VGSTQEMGMKKMNPARIHLMDNDDDDDDDDESPSPSKCKKQCNLFYEPHKDNPTLLKNSHPIVIVNPRDPFLFGVKCFLKKKDTLEE